MGNVHLHILVRNYFKSIFRHIFYIIQRFWQEPRHSEQKAALGDIQRSDLSGKIIKPAEQIAVNLL